MERRKKEKSVKEPYEAPTVRLLAVRLEKVIANSRGKGTMSDGGPLDANQEGNDDEDFFGGGGNNSYQGI
jgi:hypothetical protein